MEIPNTVVKQKRGRKPKKDLNANVNTDIIHSNVSEEVISKNITINVNEINSTINTALHEDLFENTDENIILCETVNKNETDKPLTKKRGRKPKGGKIIQQLTPIANHKNNKPSIILHLKCSLKDLDNCSINNNIESYNFSNKTDLSYELIASDINSTNINDISNTMELNNTINENDYYTEDEYVNKDSDVKELWKKIKQLEYNLHINNINDKKSACFWCTYEFDNPPIYIPKYYVKNSYHVYGCFCSPECAVAYLMDENIDSSTKFERYHFINHIYAKIYNYTKNIKPAPNPYYMLDKYYGNLSIQEYRSLFKNERLFLIVDKPLTRVLPELHEDNDDFILNNKIIPSNTYQVKKKLIKKSQNKTSILNEKFGITANM